MSEAFDGMWGECAAMRALFERIERAAPTEQTILVQGETGTGKELVARSIHRRSRRAAGPFVAVNCAAIPASLVESELFGFEKGAFTGAVRAHPGLVEQAQGGTLFLDEIGELPPAVQGKLLRLLQERQLQRLGAARPRTVDVRFVAATHQDLLGAVEARTFRRDLYHRVLEISLEVPPLRDRGDDLRLLTGVLTAAAAAPGPPPAVSEAAHAALAAYDWPGNVRELENVLQRAVVWNTGGEILPADLQLPQDAGIRPLRAVLDEATERTVRDALRRHGGDAAAAAAALEIAPGELRELVRRYQIGSG